MAFKTNGCACLVSLSLSQHFTLVLLVCCANLEARESPPGIPPPLTHIYIHIQMSQKLVQDLGLISQKKDVELHEALWGVWGPEGSSSG